MLKKKKKSKALTPEGNAGDTNKIRFQRGTVQQKEAAGCTGGCVITVTGSEWRSVWIWHGDVQEITQGKELHEKKLKCEHSVNQKSKERWDCFHMAIYIDMSLKNFREEQKTGGTKPGLSALPCHWEGRGVAFTFQHGDVLWSNTNLHGRWSNSKLT